MIGAIGVAVWLSVAMSGAWAVGREGGKSGRIDAIWALSTGIAGLAAVALAGYDRPRGWIVAVFLVVWAGRLSAYLWARAGKGDDIRYAEMKKEWGDKAASRLFGFLQVQAVAAWPLVLSAYLAAASPRPAPDARDLVGALVFIGALIGETVADREMAAFKADPANRGKICERGLWAWSRHPNYFFEFLGWVGMPVLAIDLDQPWTWAAVLAPATMYALLVYLSGIPPLEATMRRSRGAAFEAYQARVSAFWPWPPRASA